MFYVENALINSLFGLLCWPAVFMALPGAFFHPFQSGPADLGTPDFTLRRAAAFDACLARLDDGSYRALDAAQDSHVHLAPLPFPVPVYGLAVEPKRHGDEQRAWEILGKLAAEDPCLRIEHVAATNETVLYGLGELHLRIVLERLREVYRFEVQTRPPRIAYRETVTAPAEGHYRHKKQSGGAGQFAEVFLRIEPLARGAGFDFADEVRGGAIPGQFIPAVEKGVREVLAYGAIAGYPVVDVRVVVYDGKHHSVDSKDIAFATAGRKAFMAAIREARPAVLEPIVQIEIAVPEHSVGDVTSDLSLRRGLVTGTSGLGAGTVAIGGQVPEAELADYQSRLNAMTSGQGRYTVALSHYEAVPPAVQQTLMGQYRVREDD